jgi:nucleotide-binding universal stress UspA family protein
MNGETMKTIISPVDFSATSLNAAQYAADLALATGAKLVLVNVFQLPISVTEIAISDTVFNDILDISKDDLDELAFTLKERTSGKIDIETEVATGTIEGEIEASVIREKPFALVMGIQDSSGMERFFLGSNTLHAIRHIFCPILAVPEQAVFHDIKKIGLACDLDHSTNIPFDKVAEWLSEFNASLDIIHVNKSEKTSSNEVSESLTIHNMLNKFRPNFHFLRGKDLSSELHDFSNLQSLDLLIIFPKQHGFGEVFGEKHAKKIILHQQIPVLAVHTI